MSRLNLVDTNNATPQQREALQPVQDRMGGTVPRPVRVLANSPATMAAFFGLHGALGKGLLTPRVREQIALAVGNAQGCRYCVSHHTQLGRRMGLTDEELDVARSGRAPDARVEAALQFARQLAARRGAVTDAELKTVREAGWSDEEVVEIMGQVVATTFGNYLNHLAQVEFDVPPVDLVPAAVLEGIHA